MSTQTGCDTSPVLGRSSVDVDQTLPCLKLFGTFPEALECSITQEHQTNLPWPEGDSAKPVDLGNPGNVTGQLLGMGANPKTWLAQGSSKEALVGRPVTPWQRRLGQPFSPRNLANIRRLSYMSWVLQAWLLFGP